MQPLLWYTTSLDITYLLYPLQLSLAVLILTQTIIYAQVPQHAPIHAPVYAPVHYQHTPPLYHYTYNVLDEYAGLNYGHLEDRDGYKTKGLSNF